MKIRKATAKDLNGVYELFLEMVTSEDRALRKCSTSFLELRKKERDFEKKARKELLREIRARYSLFLVAEENNKLIGYAYGEVPKKSDAFFAPRNTAFFYALLVTKKHRRKGIANKLKLEMEKWFRKKKVDYIYLEAFAMNPAVNLYKKWGYKIAMHKMFKKVRR
ncbi:GNAT family N-acetyltransferase [Candidatus Woesearchaeota archaeon]|nr:GNAT family N-acetyltransferase [Candidatus Woesearchaeota archaeon]